MCVLMYLLYIGPGNCDWKTVDIAYQHLGKVADEIRLLDADIVSLEEVRDCAVLRELIKLLPNSGYMPYMVLGTDTYTGQNVGLLTRVDPVEGLTRSESLVSYPVKDSTCNTKATPIPSAPLAGSYGCSKHYTARFKIAGFSKPISLFGVHLLAIPDDTTRCVQREAQATVIAQLIQKAVSAGDEIIALGDFNDYDRDVAQASGDQPISSVLK
jgi:hypothetical protein